MQVMTKLENEQFAKNKSAADRHTLEAELAAELKMRDEVEG